VPRLCNHSELLLKERGGDQNGVSSMKSCPECDSILPVESPHGLCPKCLLGRQISGNSSICAAEQMPAEDSSTVPVPSTFERPGDLIGRYKLLQKLGEGGCGIVYMAEQQEPVKRRVALKVIKLGMDTVQVIARFEAERQALALMDHPNIAKVLDGGTTSTGRPYFVMELVRGVPITRFCDENRLDTRRRLELFILVCRAIQHAHQKGIIHRDIKPSNILVADHDGTPVPKVIDFGIAKATAGQTLTDKTLFTAFEQFLGTPAYMSPEQATLSGVDVDTRSDIYSLGVLLYELLTGKTPFDIKEFRAAGLDAIRRVICEQEPPRPSTRLSTMQEGELRTTALQRKSEPPSLRNLLRGDLDWIVMRTLEKDRSRRYETANGLAMDLHRHLSNEPVMACPPSALYRLQKIVRRNRLVFAAAAAVMVSLLAGLGLSTWLLLQERAARRRAEIADRNAETEASMLSAMVMSPADVSRYESVIRASLDRQKKSQGSNHDLIIQSLNALSMVCLSQNKPVESEAALREAVALARESMDRDPTRASARLGLVLHHLAFVLREKKAPADARPFAEEAFILYERHPDWPDFERLHAFQVLDGVLRDLGEWGGLEVFYRRALAMEKRLPGNDDAGVTFLLYPLAAVLEHNGKRDEAEGFYHEAAAKFRNGAQSGGVEEQFNLGTLYESGRGVTQDYAEALKWYRKAADQGNANAENNLGWLYKNGWGVDRDYVEAVSWFRRSAERGNVTARCNLADMYSKGQGVTQDSAEALKWYRKAAEQGQAGAQWQVGQHYANGEGGAKDLNEAVKWYRKAAEQGDAEGQSSLADCYRDGSGVEKDYAQAARWFRKAAEGGSAYAQRALGLMCANGQGVNKDLAEALKWFSLASDQGDAEAQLRLGWMYESGDGVAKNAAEAMKWYRKGADQGSAYCENNVGVLYQKGFGVAKDSVEAAKWILKSADHGLADAQMNLGAMYLKGEGVPADPAEAVKWYHKAAEQGNADAQNDLAWLLATFDDPKIRDGRGAVHFAQSAVETTHRKDPNKLGTLAAAYAEAGQFTNAVTSQKEAIALLQDEGTRREFNARLRLYESNSPYREQ